MKKNEELYKKADEAFKFIKSARDNAIDTLAGIIRDAGGLIPTLPSNDKPRITAYQDIDGEVSVVTVFGLREVDGEVYLCTTDNIYNYEYDNNYSFEYYYDFADEDLDEIKKVLSDIKNFSSIYDDEIIRSATIYSILAGLVDYV